MNIAMTRIFGRGMRVEWVPNAVSKNHELRAAMETIPMVCASAFVVS
jgi:hypothetical protein